MTMARPPIQYEKGAIAAKSGVMFGEDIWLISAAGDPTDGASGTGAGWAGVGSLYVNTTAGTLFQNTGTKASPTWSTRT